jgi:hypothetical protein
MKYWMPNTAGVPPDGGDGGASGYADVSATAPDPASPDFSPPEGLLWVDTSSAVGPSGTVGGYAAVSATPPDATVPVWTPPDGFLWVDTSAD